MQEKELIQGIINGDHKAFEIIFKEYFSKLYRFSYDFVNDHDVAREIAQDSFVKLWEIKSGIRKDSKIDSLLFTICRNHCLNFIKHLKIVHQYKQTQQSDFLDMEYKVETISSIRVDKIDFQLLEKQIEESIGKLPEQCRKVFVMSRYYEMKYSEIAEQMNISVKTVEAHISQALKRLREELKDFL